MSVRLPGRGDADMTQGVIWKQLLQFSIPMAIGLLFQQLYNTVDTVVVGRFVGKEALAAVGSTGSIVNMLVGLCAGLSTGAGVVISQTYGAHDDEGLHNAVHTTVTVTFLLCLIATFAGMAIVRPMLRAMDTPQDVFPEAERYLTVYFAGISGLLLYNMGSGILRAVGDSTRPLYFLIFSALVNIAFDLLFVIRFRLGVTGVAYATILSQFLSAVLVFVVLTRTKAAYGIRWKKLCIRGAVLKKIFSIGMPSGIQQALTSFSNVFVQSYINFFGSACMAGWSACSKLDAFILIPVQSIALASTTFVGQNVGAKKLSRAKDGVRQALIIALVITASLSAVVIPLRRGLLSLFTEEADVLEYGARFVALIAPFYVTVCFNQIYAGALRGTGDARTPMLVMLGSFVVFRQIFLYVTKLLNCGFIPVALAYPMGWICCSVLMIFFYHRAPISRAQPEETGNAA
ncbi:MAG: MATE family efflux transporter [Eubacteriales bacterium]|nr:MATE family efflux transporter [Eubacteriales bacterium]